MVCSKRLFIESALCYMTVFRRLYRSHSIILDALHIRALNSQDDFPKKVQVGKDQEKAQSEKDSHSKNRGGKKPN